jgi:hypothetical protein
MALIAKNFSRPDDTVSFPNGRDDLVRIGEVSVGRAEFRPGWKWSNDVKPIAGTETCQVHHRGYLLGGVLHVELAGGGAADLREGDVYDIPPGHDAWVVGDDPVRMVDWSRESATYVRPAR